MEQETYLGDLAQILYGDSSPMVRIGLRTLMTEEQIERLLAEAPVYDDEE